MRNLIEKRIVNEWSILFGLVRAVGYTEGIRGLTHYDGYVKIYILWLIPIWTKRVAV